MANRDPPAISLTTTTSRPVTHTTTTTYTIGGGAGGGRRSRNANRDSAASDEAHLRAPTPNNEAPEPFPAMSPMPTTGSLQQTRSRGDYFSQPPMQYQIRSRPIGIRRLPSSTDVEQTGSSRPHSGSLTRRRTNTAPSQRLPPESATAGLAGLPGHYDLAPHAGMETIGEGQEVHHGQNRDSDGVGRSGSTRLRRLSNAASTAARSITSKLSDDPEEGYRSRRNTREYENDVVDYLDVLGKLCNCSPR